MRTDIPLKVLTQACAADLLPLLDAPHSTVIAVETLELPMASVALDVLLHLRSASGAPYLHLLEWQGYRDPLILWRVLHYLSWLGLHRPERPVTATLVYLSPADDVGDTLVQEAEGAGRWTVRLHVVRLWELDAQAAVAGRRPGLAVLSPLMHGANATLVEQAAQIVLTQAEPLEQRDDLLTILGVFAEPFVGAERFMRLVGKERLMASELISYLFKDELAAAAAAAAAAAETAAAAAAEAAAEAAAAAEREHAALVEMVVDVVTTRFPETPIGAAAAIQEIREAERLQALHRALLRAPDQASADLLLRNAV